MDGIAITAATTATLLAALRRADGPRALLGCPDPATPDEGVALVSALATCPLPLVLACGPVIGPGALVALLAADGAFAPPGAVLAEDWATVPGLAALLVRRHGGATASGVLLGGQSPLSVAAGQGALRTDPDPAAAAMREVARWRDDPMATRLRRALVAAAELPLAEAARFDSMLWHPATGKGDAA